MRKKIIVLGGGLVGMAVALKLKNRYPNCKIHVFEKEHKLGLHQSTRNSGVIHCGISYTHGSLKARLSTSGSKQLIDYAKSKNIKHDLCGKLVISQNSEQNKRIEYLAQNGQKNGLKGLTILSGKETSKIEPYVKAEKSLLVPEEGIIDFQEVISNFSLDFQLMGGEIHLSSEFLTTKKLSNSNIAVFKNFEIEFDYLINCSGLYSDRIYKQTCNEKSDLQIIPFRGEYFQVHRDDLFNRLIYPVPDPKFPFLGVHFTKLISGEKEVGPNAVLALHREGYNRRKVSFKDSLETLSYSGLMKFIIENFDFVSKEVFTSLSKRAFLNEAKKLIPELELSDLGRARSGVRAQGITRDGKLYQDFLVNRVNNEIHVLNAPSPGATSCLAIADYVIDNYLQSIK